MRSFLETLSVPMDSNHEPPRYKLGALTIELGTGLMRGHCDILAE
ncbi:MAG: hypothetical protein QG633_364 [Patescibacteria group bacterium]|nr:hypothetical protein [Patescibacteria group bacterium]